MKAIAAPTDQFESASWQQLKRTRAKIALSPHIDLLLDPGPFGRCEVCLEPGALKTKDKHVFCGLACMKMRANSQ